jgi:YHS domain-containing protein
MRKERTCDCCNKVVKDDFFCDTCEEDLLTKYLGVPITINFSYGHELDGSEYHFCNFSCLLKFIATELMKQKREESLNGKE